MNKKSLNCVESEISSSRTELNNAAIQDIIPTNNIILGKESYRGRVSSVCKAVIFLIIFGFIVLGIIALTLVLANSRNRYLAWANRFNDEKIVDRFNATQRLYVQRENLTRDFDQKENNDVSTSKDQVEYRPTSTVSLTTDHFEGETSEMVNLHRSSLIMHTNEMNDEDFSSQTLSMKPYPSLNTITNERLTSLTTTTTSTTTTVQTSTTTTSTVSSDIHRTKTVISIDNELRTTEANRRTTEGEIVTTKNIHQSDESLTSTTNIPTTSTTSITNEDTSIVTTEGLFTTFLNNHFDFESSTTMTTKVHRRKLSRLHQAVEDFIDDLVFS